MGGVAIFHIAEVLPLQRIIQDELPTEQLESNKMTL
jgi:hypothetical protein